MTSIMTITRLKVDYIVNVLAFIKTNVIKSCDISDYIESNQDYFDHSKQENIINRGLAFNSISDDIVNRYIHKETKNLNHILQRIIKSLKSKITDRTISNAIKKIEFILSKNYGVKRMKSEIEAILLSDFDNTVSIFYVSFMGWENTLAFRRTLQ